VFAYPVNRHNRKVRNERLDRCVAAPKASHELRPSQDLDSCDLAKVDCPAFPCEVCTGAPYIWNEIDAGRSVNCRLCEECVKDLHSIDGIPVSTRMPDFPLALTAVASAGILLLATVIHLPLPAYDLLRIVI
jgi:hypothetical protein